MSRTPLCLASPISVDMLTKQISNSRSSSQNQKQHPEATCTDTTQCKVLYQTTLEQRRRKIATRTNLEARFPQWGGTACAPRILSRKWPSRDFGCKPPEHDSAGSGVAHREAVKLAQLVVKVGRIEL